MYRWRTNLSKASSFSVLRWRIRKHICSGEHLQKDTNYQWASKTYSTGIKRKKRVQTKRIPERQNITLQ